MPREPFTRDQLAYIERAALRSLVIWNRALNHLDRIGAINHPLHRVIRQAHDAEHALRVHSMYARQDDQRRAENGRAL